jgi:hypothetical protein
VASASGRRRGGRGGGAPTLDRVVAAVGCSGRRRGVRGWARPVGRSRPKRSGGGRAVRANGAKKVGRADLAARAETKEEFLSEF